MQRSMAQTVGLDGRRRSRWALTRNTNKQLEDTTLKTVLEWFPPHIYGDWRPSDSRYLVRGLRAAGTTEPCDIELLFRALDRPDQVATCSRLT
jgi:hypothetical protein